MRGLRERSFFWPVRHPLPRVRAKSLGSNTHLTFPVVYLSLCAAGAQDLGFCWFWRLNDDGMGVSYDAVALTALRPVFSRWCAAVLIFPFPRLTTWLLFGILKNFHGIFARRSVLVGFFLVFFCFCFFAFPSYISGVHHFWARFLRMWPFLNPTIKVVTVRLRGWWVLGVFLLPAFTRLGHERQDLLSPCDEMHVCKD